MISVILTRDNQVGGEKQKISVEILIIGKENVDSLHDMCGGFKATWAQR